MRASFAIGLILTSILVTSAIAEDAEQASKPAKYLWTQQVTLAGGKAATYPGLIAQSRRAADSTKSETYWIGASNITGDLRQVVYLSFCDDFAAIEKNMLGIGTIGAEAMQKNPNFAAESGQHQVEQRSTVSVFREDLSYNPGEVPLSEAKFWAVTTFYLTAGHMSDFADQVKEEIELLKRAGLDHHFLVYQVLVGLPSSGSVFYVAVPRRTLAEMDVDDSDKAKAVFTPTVRHRFEMMNQQMISHIESDILLVRPDLSRPPASYVAANPEFWTVKEQFATVEKNRTKKKVVSGTVAKRE